MLQTLRSTTTATPKGASRPASTGGNSGAGNITPAQIRKRLSMEELKPRFENEFVGVIGDLVRKKAISHLCWCQTVVSVANAHYLGTKGRSFRGARVAGVGLVAICICIEGIEEERVFTCDLLRRAMGSSKIQGQIC